MRLAVCALSAVLMSGCSWLGMGGNSSGNYGAGVYGANCGGYGTSGAYNVGGAAGCGGAGGYGVAGSGYGAGYGTGAGYGAAGYGTGAGYGAAGYGTGAGYGAAGYGTGAGYGAAGYGTGAGYGAAGYGTGAGYGATGYGTGAGYGAAGYGTGAGYGAGYGTGAGYGAGTAYNSAALGLGAASAYGAAGYGQTTTLGASAPYGAAVGGAYGTQFGATQYGTQGNVTTVAGAPIYVPQPYPSYYGVPQLRGVPVAVAGGGALPFGIEAGIGTNFFADGDIFGAKPAGPALGSSTIHVSATDAISYDDAYKNAVNYDLATTYDVNRNTTLLGRVGYSKADGEAVKFGSVSDSTGTEDLYAEFSDLEQWTVEGGVRRYLGGWNNPNGGFRPYVGATGGFTHVDDVNVSQYSASILPNGSNVQQFIEGGWSPTAAGLVGAEWQVGGTTAVGVETGVRWTDYDTVADSDAGISIPVRLRGRVSF